MVDQVTGGSTVLNRWWSRQTEIKKTQMSIYSYFRKTVECGLYRTRQFSGSMANEDHEVRSQVVSEKMQKCPL